MNHLDVIGSDGCKVATETQGATLTSKSVLDDAATRMLSSIQDTLGFSAAEDAILKWLEGCSVEGVERLSFAIEDYLQNRKEAESTEPQS
jgi:hypothetical protein